MQRHDTACGDVQHQRRDGIAGQIWLDAVAECGDRRTNTEVTAAG